MTGAPAARMRRSAFAGLAAVSLALSGCAESAGEPMGIARTSACAVSAPAGFADAGIGEAVFEQVRFAARQGVVDSTSAQRVSTAAQTQAALERYAADSCTLTVVVGSGGSRALAQVAEDYEERVFLAVGAGSDAGQPDNVLTVDFDLRESAYLSGFAAASATETGVVAVSVARGQHEGALLLEAFDDGVREYSEQEDTDVSVIDGGAVDPRTVDDTIGDGGDWASSALAADADVLVPFGSALPQGVADHLVQLAEPDDGDEDSDEPESGTDAGDDDAESRAGEAGASEGPAGASAAVPHLPALIWYGSDGSETLPRPVRDQVVASIVPQVAQGMRAVLSSWPGDGGDPEALVTGSEEEASNMVPELVGGLEVQARRAVGTLDNGGIDLVVSDGMLGSITGLGRTLAEERERRAEEREQRDSEPADG